MMQESANSGTVTLLTLFYRRNSCQLSIRWMLVLGVNGDLNVAFISHVRFEACRFVSQDVSHTAVISKQICITRCLSHSRYKEADLYHKLLVTQPLETGRFISQGVSHTTVVSSRHQ